MQCRVFNIRLSKTHLKADESALNDFLASVQVSQTYPSVVSDNINFWSVLVVYEDKTDVSEETPSEDVQPAEADG